MSIHEGNESHADPPDDPNSVADALALLVQLTPELFAPEGESLRGTMIAAERLLRDHADTTDRLAAADPCSDEAACQRERALAAEEHLSFVLTERDGLAARLSALTDATNVARLVRNQDARSAEFSPWALQVPNGEYAEVLSDEEAVEWGFAIAAAVQPPDSTPPPTTCSMKFQWPADNPRPDEWCCLDAGHAGWCVTPTGWRFAVDDRCVATPPPTPKPNELTWSDIQRSATHDESVTAKVQAKFDALENEANPCPECSEPLRWKMGHYCQNCGWGS